MKFRLLVEFVTQTNEKFKKYKLSIFQPHQTGGRVKSENFGPLDQSQPNFVYIFCGPPEGLYTNSVAPNG